jgi:hypothetical protein
VEPRQQTVQVADHGNELGRGIRDRHRRPQRLGVHPFQTVREAVQRREADPDHRLHQQGGPGEQTEDHERQRHVHRGEEGVELLPSVGDRQGDSEVACGRALLVLRLLAFLRLQTRAEADLDLASMSAIRQGEIAQPGPVEGTARPGQVPGAEGPGAQDRRAVAQPELEVVRVLLRIELGHAHVGGLQQDPSRLLLGHRLQGFRLVDQRLVVFPAQP